MIKLWLSVSSVLVNANACKVERCLMRHLLSAAPGGLCRAWLEFVPPSRSGSTSERGTTPAGGSAAAWKGPSVTEGLTHWVSPPSCKGLSLGETLQHSQSLCSDAPGMGHVCCVAGVIHICSRAVTSDSGSTAGKWCRCLNLGTMGRWPVPPCNGRSLGEGKRTDAAGQV